MVAAGGAGEELPDQHAWSGRDGYVAGRDLTVNTYQLRASGRPLTGPGITGEHVPTELGSFLQVSETNLRWLGVHAAINVPGVTDDIPPEYVARDVDDEVRARVAAAAERGGFILLVGGSSVGKSRCAAEAIRALLGDWWLVHPADPDEVAALAGRRPRRAVVWLDELQRYLDSEHGLVGGVIRALLNGPDPVVVIGTLWPERYTAYAELPSAGGADDHSRHREVVDLATIVRVGPDFSPSELARARAAASRDPRLRVALRTGEYGLTQTLAAAPQLVARWEDARTASPYAWAVLTAALDLARLGVRAPLAPGLLCAAAEDYCTSQQQAEAPVGWFEQALAYATAKLHGAAAALIPEGAGMGKVAGYTVADYLVQHASRERRSAHVPASTWNAAISHIHDPADSARLADSARARLLHCYALPLYQSALDNGSAVATRQRAGLLAEPSAPGSLPLRAGAGYRNAARQLARLLAGRGDLREAEQVLGAHTHIGGDEQEAARQQADRRTEQSDLDGAEQTLRDQADAGDRAAARNLAHLLARRGKLDGAEQILLAGAGTGDQIAAMWLAGLMAGRGDLDGLRARVFAGDADAAIRLADVLARQGDLDEAEQILRDQAGIPDRFGTQQLAAEQLARLLAGRGDLDGVRARARAGDADAAFVLADVLAKRGDLEGAEQVLRAREDAGDRLAAERIADLLAQRGDIDGLRARAEAGEWLAAMWLVALLGQCGDVDGLRTQADTGDWLAAERHAGLLAARGDLDGLRARASAGDGNAAMRLADMLTDQGDLDRAAQVLQTAVAAGYGGAAPRLLDVLVRQGRQTEADQLRRFGFNHDGSIASR